jgi:hypothetical protein
VLEHGAFADASNWNGVIERLQKEGYPVIAIANPLRGPGSHAAALRSVLHHVQGNVGVSTIPTAARSSELADYQLAVIGFWGVVVAG